MIAVQRILERHEIIQSSREFTEVLCHPSEVCEGLVEAPSQRYPISFHMVEGLLHVAEEAHGAG